MLKAIKVYKEKMGAKFVFRILELLIGFILFPCFAPVQAALEDIHHVILLIDRSGSIDRSIYSLESAFEEELGEILFKGIDGLPALYRTNHDEVSILFFGIRYGEQFSTDYIHPYLMHSRNFTDADLSTLYEQYRNHLFQSFRQGRYWTALSAAPYYGLYKSRSNTSRYQKTYLITLTDGQFNDQPERELDYLKENPNSRIKGTDEAKKVCLDIKNLYDIQFRGQREVGRLKLAVYEVAVKYSPRELIKKLPNEIELKRQYSLYTATQEISTVESQSLSPPYDSYKLLQIGYQIVDTKNANRPVQEEKLLSDRGFIDIRLEKAQRRNLSLVVRVKYFYLFDDKYYGNQIVSVQDDMQVRFEPTKYIWGFIPIPNLLLSLHAGKSQDDIRRIYNFIGILLLVAIVLLIVWLIIRPQIEPGWEFVQTNSDVTLNFNNPDRPNVRIGTVKIFNKVRAWYKLKGNFQFNLVITATCPDYLVQSPLTPLFQRGEPQALLLFEADGRETATIENMQVAQEVNVGIYLNLNAISDCNNLTVREVVIPFTLVTQAKVKGKNKLSDDRESKVTLKLIPESQKIGFKLEMDAESIEHRRLEKPVIGRLMIQNKVAKKYSTPLNCDIVLTIPGQPAPLKNGFFFEIPNPLESDKANLLEPNTVRIQKFQKGETISLNLKADFAIIPNPKEKEPYPFEIHDGAGNRLTQGQITILKDSTHPELFLQARRYDGEIIYEFDGVPPAKSLTIERTLVRDASQIEICEIIFGNSALSGRAYILIDGKVSKFEETQESLSQEEKLKRLFEQLYGVAPLHKVKSIQERLFVLENNDALQNWGLHQKQIQNGTAPEQIKIYANIKPEEEVSPSSSKGGEYEDLPDELSFKLEFQFDYTLCRDDGQIIEEGKHLTLPFVVTLKKDLGGYWLSLDYGTSAIACIFDDNPNIAESDIDVRLVNLQRQFLALNGPAENPETGTPFIRSTIMLNPGAKIGDKSFVYLEFLEALAAQFPERLVPYLKKIVGFKEVPLPSELDYLDSNGNKITGRPLLKDVLTSLYQKLVEDYIQPSIEVSKQEYLNKIIFSIPNTFSPYHIEWLREIIQSNFGKLFREIDFISESDAVAFYYLQNWQRLNQDRETSSREFLEIYDEYILIYDIGAGTLDITYLKVHKGESGPTQIEMFSKLGKSIGGNNLDTILARIIDGKLRQMAEMKFSGLYPKTGDIEHRNAMIGLKHVVRDGVKLEYSKWWSEGEREPEKTIQVQVNEIADGMEEGLELKCGEIAESSEIQKFIQNNTKTVLEQFFNLLGYEQGNVPIDTVILSGRTTLFPNMKEGVRETIKNWAKSAPWEVSLTANELKSAVCLGALAYAVTWRRHQSIRIIDKNIWAKYGIPYRDKAMKWRFAEFISPNTPPTKTHNIGGRIFHDYEVSHTIDFTNTPQIQFIQTYSPHPAADLSKGDYGLITFLKVLNKDPFSSKPKITVKLDWKNQLTLEIEGIAYPIDLNQSDLEKDVSYREGMWPLL